MTALGITALLILLAVWAGYPVIVYALAARRTPPAPRGCDDLPVSVIIATNAGGEAIRKRVTNILASAYEGQLDVIVALDVASAPSLRPDLSMFGSAVRVVPGDAPGGKAATLNAGVRAARHEVLVFADIGQRFEPGAIAALVRALETDERTGAVSGLLELPRATGGAALVERYWRFERWLREQEARLHTGFCVTGAIYAMRRSLWTPLPPGLILDDVYVPMRLALSGWRIGFADAARAADVRQFTPAEEYRRKVRTLTGLLQLCVWLPAAVRPWQNPVWVSFTFHKLLRLLTPYLALAGVAGLAIGLGPLVHDWMNGLELLLAAAAIVAVTAIPRLRRRVAQQLTWAAAMHGSMIVATVNGLRGRWDVWR